MAEYLRRYMDLPSLFYLLAKRRLTLVDPRSWDDANDSHYMELYRRAGNFASVLAACFTQASEKYHHWRVFAGTPAGVCVTFKRSALLNAVRDVRELRAGAVSYLKLSEMRERNRTIAELPFLKRLPFQDEREFRMVWHSESDRIQAFDVEIPLSAIERITLSPWLQEPLADHVKFMIRQIEDCAPIRTTRSTLVANAEWKNLGEAACGTSPNAVMTISALALITRTPRPPFLLPSPPSTSQSKPVHHQVVL